MKSHLDDAVQGLRQSEKEKEVLGTLVAKLRIPEDEAKELLEAAEARAKRLLELL